MVVPALLVPLLAIVDIGLLIQAAGSTNAVLTLSAVMGVVAVCAVSSAAVKNAPALA